VAEAFRISVACQRLVLVATRRPRLSGIRRHAWILTLKRIVPPDRDTPDEQLRCLPFLDSQNAS